jgi:hypothetical protein
LLVILAKGFPPVVNNKDDSMLLLTSTRETVNVCLKPSRKDSIGYLKGEIIFFKKTASALSHWHT